jgi:hypothetical protein
MIPTMMVLGLVLGRWPWIALGAAVVTWPLLLVASDAATLTDVGTLLGGVVLAVVNAGIGVLAHQALLRTWRYARHPVAPVRAWRPSGRP